MPHIKISIIVPVYNVEKYLAFCLDTIFRQTLKDIEVICIDDGSTDGSLTILKEYSVRYGNLKIITQENHGVGYARNIGMKAASGEYIAFMDPDDYYLERDTLEILYEKAHDNDVLICGGSLSEDHDDGKWIRKKFDGIYEKYTFYEEGIVQYRDYQFDFGFYRFIYNRDFLMRNHIFFPEYIRFQDPPFFVTAMVTAGKFYAIKNYTYCYRYGHQNLVWNEKRICDLIRGHMDNLRISSEFGYRELHLLTLYRLAVISAPHLMSGIMQGSVPMMRLLGEAQELVKDDWAVGNSIGSVYDGIFQSCVDLENQVEALSKSNKKLKKAVSKKDAEIIKTKNSRTFRLGKALLAIPRKIKNRPRKTS